VVVPTGHVASGKPFTSVSFSCFILKTRDLVASYGHWVCIASILALKFQTLVHVALSYFCLYSSLELTS
jgi:hypothetical protein